MHSPLGYSPMCLKVNRSVNPSTLTMLARGNRPDSLLPSYWPFSPLLKQSGALDR